MEVKGNLRYWLKREES